MAAKEYSMNKKLFHTLERECLIYLSKKEATLELLRPLINEFLSTQPEHLLLILAKEEQTTDAVSQVIAHQYTNAQCPSYFNPSGDTPS